MIISKYENVVGLMKNIIIELESLKFFTLPNSIKQYAKLNQVIKILIDIVENIDDNETNIKNYDKFKIYRYMTGINLNLLHIKQTVNKKYIKTRNHIYKAFMHYASLIIEYNNIVMLLDLDIKYNIDKLLIWHTSLEFLCKDIINKVYE